MLPLILLGASVVAGLAGATAAIDAMDKNDRAEDIVEDAQRRLNRKKDEVEKTVNSFTSEVEKAGTLRLKIYKKDFERFRKIGELLKRKMTSESNSSEILESFDEFLIELDMDIEGIKSLENMLSLKNVGEATAKSILAGALAYAGAVGIAEAVGVASTGTAISSLSGAAFTNALLAWFGGGSLAAGGLGIAGGTAILGGIVAGPAIAILGFCLNAAAEKKLTQAYEFKAEVEKQIAKMEDIQKKALKNIEIVKEDRNNTLDIRERYFNRLIILENLVQERMNVTEENPNYIQFLEKRIKIEFEKTLLLAKSLKKIIREPLKDKLISFEEN